MIMIACLLGWLLATSAHAQSRDVWKALTKIEWYQKYSDLYKMQIGFPKFSEEAKALAGKEIVITGYILPMDTEDGSVIISSVPYSSCFFCGGAGIETVMAVFMKRPRKFSMDAATFKGVLELNEKENGLIYNLRQAEEVATVE